MKEILEELQTRGLIYQHTDLARIASLPKGTSFYLGFDPSAPLIHIGHLVPLTLMVHLARAGLKPIFLFGGATGSIGDPSFRNSERPLLTREQIDENVRSHERVINSFFKRAGVEATFVNNFDWTKDVTILEFLRDVGKHITVNYMLAKESVKSRIEGDGISFTEFSYMLLQAFDFLHLFQSKNCKLQIGGQDQWGNMTPGLELIRKVAKGEGDVLSVPLLTTSDGKKFGKTSGAPLWLNPEATSPYQFHQYWLNVSDDDVVRYLKVFTYLPLSEISQVEEVFKKAPHERLAQRTLADYMTTLIHGEQATEEAKRAAECLFTTEVKTLSLKQLEEMLGDVPTATLSGSQLKEISAVDLFTLGAATKSKGEARRLIKDGGAYINNERVSVETLPVTSDMWKSGFILLRSGKKNYYLVRVEE